MGNTKAEFKLAMNRTHLHHALIALTIMLAFATFGAIWFGAGFGSGAYFMREVTQNEAKTRNHTPPTHRFGRLLWPLRGFAFWRWSRDAQLDALAPLIACLTLAAIMEVVNG